MTTQSPRQSPSAADLLGPKIVLECQKKGRRAALDGAHVRDCPHSDTTSENRARRAMWIRGYAAGRTDLRAARE